MTKEENIATLNEHLEHWKRLLSEKICDQSDGEKTIYALQNAIKALEQEPCEDCIRRQDLREPRFIIAENDYQKGWNDALESVYENAPSIQPQPKVGRWIYHDGYIPYKHECSECGKRFGTDFHYCPNCGAKM